MHALRSKMEPFLMFKTIVLLVIVCSCKSSTGNILIQPPERDNLSHSIEIILRKVFSNRNTELYVFAPDFNYYIDDKISYIVSHAIVPVQIEWKIEKLSDRKRSHVLLIIDSVQTFDKFYQQLTVDNFNPNGKFIIMFENVDADSMDIIFAKLWRRYVFNVLIIRKSESIEMFTFMPFRSDNKCGDDSSVKINQFDIRSMSWENTNFFPNKFKDLHGCSIRCGLFSLPPVNIVQTKGNGTYKLSGFDVDIFKAFLASMNGKVKFFVYDIDTGRIFPNGSVTGLLGRMIKGDVDTSLRSWSLQLDRRKILTETVSHYSDKLVLLMPRSEIMNPLFKFIKPMQPIVWAAIGVVIFASGIAVYLFKIIPQPYYRMIIGRNLRNESLNLLIGIVGLSQTNLPQKNFPRFLLMMFLILCLIIRSLYLGSLFNMLKTELREREYVSIRDFYEAGFKFYMYETLSERLDYPLINERRVIIPLAEVDKYSLKTLDVKFKGVVFQYVTNALYNNMINQQNFTYKICKESLMTNHWVIYFRQGFYLVDAMNDKIRLFKSSGITQHIMEKYADEKYRKIDDGANGPKKLTLWQFSGMFQLWGFGLSTAILLFISEIIYSFLISVKSGNRIKLNDDIKRMNKEDPRSVKDEQHLMQP